MVAELEFDKEAAVHREFHAQAAYVHCSLIICGNQFLRSLIFIICVFDKNIYFPNLQLLELLG